MEASHGPRRLIVQAAALAVSKGGKKNHVFSWFGVLEPNTEAGKQARLVKQPVAAGSSVIENPHAHV